MLGGIQAVIWTDAIQGIILILGAIVCAILITFSMPEGAGQIFTIAAENNKFSLGSFSSSLADSTFWVVLIYGSIYQSPELWHRSELCSAIYDYKYRERGKSISTFRITSYISRYLLFSSISGLLFFHITLRNPDLLPAGSQSSREREIKFSLISL